MKQRLKKLLALMLVSGVLAGGYYGLRLLPLVTTDNAGAAKVVLLHGLGRNEMAMLLMESALTGAGFDVHNIGYPSTELPPEDLLEMVTEEIDACCGNGSQTVHFVGHSFGGLLIRAYLGRNRLARLGRVVLLGAPNKGSELADGEAYASLPDSLTKWAGPTARALHTGPEGFPATLPPPAYPVGVIAGTRESHLTSQWLPSPNDGMVSVDSARLDGMADFITLEAGHWELRSEPEVAEQVVAFLEHGAFEHNSGKR